MIARLIKKLWVIGLVISLLIIGYCYIPSAHQVSKNNSTISGFVLVQDDNKNKPRTTFIRLRDGYTDYLRGAWKFMASDAEHFFAISQDSNTKQFYFISPDSIHQFHAEYLPGPILNISAQENNTAMLIIGETYHCYSQINVIDGPVCDFATMNNIQTGTDLTEAISLLPASSVKTYNVGMGTVAYFSDTQHWYRLSNHTTVYRLSNTDFLIQDTMARLGLFNSDTGEYQDIMQTMPGAKLFYLTSGSVITVP